MLLISGAAADPERGRGMAATALGDGSAWAKFQQFVAAQGGDVTAIEDPGRLPHAPFVEPLRAPRAGYVAQVDAREVGHAVVDLGGGRAAKGDPIDPAVGVVLAEHGKVGAQVEAGEPLLWVHGRTRESLDAALTRLTDAYRFSADPVARPALVYQIMR
jgi:thymidine phosphorylase